MLFLWKVVNSCQANVKVTLVDSLVDKLTDNEMDQNVEFWETRVKVNLTNN